MGAQKLSKLLVTLQAIEEYVRRQPLPRRQVDVTFTAPNRDQELRTDKIIRDYSPLPRLVRAGLKVDLRAC